MSGSECFIISDWDQNIVPGMDDPNDWFVGELSLEGNNIVDACFLEIVIIRSRVRVVFVPFVPVIVKEGVKD